MLKISDNHQKTDQQLNSRHHKINIGFLLAAIGFMAVAFIFKSSLISSSLNLKKIQVNSLIEEFGQMKQYYRSDLDALIRIGSIFDSSYFALVDDKSAPGGEQWYWMTTSGTGALSAKKATTAM